MSTSTIAASKQSEAEAIVNKYIPWAMGAGLVPVPLVDIAAVTGIQIKMLGEIAKTYGIPFSENSGKAVIGSLVGGVGAFSIAGGTVGSLVKAIPGFGTIIGAATLPVIAGASTYAIGKVFVQHFESGGTFLSFDSLEGKKVFSEKFAEGKAKAV